MRRTIQKLVVGFYLCGVAIALLGAAASAVAPEFDGSIRGSVLDSLGTPVADVQVDLFSGADGIRQEFLTSTTTDGEGQYEFALEAGCYVVTMVAPAGSTFAGSLWLQRSGCIDASDPVFLVDGELIETTASLIGGLVTDADGQPVEGTTVDLFAAQADGTRGQYLVSSISDDEGIYLFEAPAGCYVLTVIATAEGTFRGSRWLQGVACVGPDELAVIEDAVYDRFEPAIVEGGVRLLGESLPGVQVDLFRANADGGRGEFLDLAITSQFGGYRFEVETGCYVVTVIAPDGLQFANGDSYESIGTCVEAGNYFGPIGPSRLFPISATGVVRGTLVSSVGDPVAGVEVSFFANNGPDDGEFVDSVRTGQDGTYRYVTSPSCYRIVITAPEGDGFFGEPTLRRDSCVRANDEVVFSGRLDRPRPTSTANVSFQLIPLLEGGSGQRSEGLIRVGVNPAPTVPLTVDLRTIDGTAIAGEDYEPIEMTVRFAPGEWEKDIPVTIIGDDLPESDEEFVLWLSNPSAGLRLSSSPINTAKIVDDDLDQLVASLRGGYSAGEEGEQIYYQVNLNGPATEEVSVTLRSQDITAEADLGDYVPLAETMTFAPGEQYKSGTVDLLADDVEEGHEFFLLTISEPSEGLALGLDAQFARILNESVDFLDSAISVRTDLEEVYEGESLTVQISPRWRNAVVSGTVQVRAIAATASEDDIPLLDETVEIEGFVNELTVTVPEDATVEPDEVFLIRISDPTNGLVLATDVASVVVLDDDGRRSAPRSGLRFAASGSEEDGSALLSLQLSNNQATDELSFDVTTVSLTAVEGVDFEPVQRRFTISPEQAGGSDPFLVPISIIDDGDVEGNEQFMTILSDPSPDLVLTDRLTLVTIRDNDTP